MLGNEASTTCVNASISIQSLRLSRSSFRMRFCLGGRYGGARGPRLLARPRIGMQFIARGSFLRCADAGKPEGDAACRRQGCGCGLVTTVSFFSCERLRGRPQRCQGRLSLSTEVIRHRCRVVRCYDLLILCRLVAEAFSGPCRRSYQGPARDRVWARGPASARARDRAIARRV